MNYEWSQTLDQITIIFLDEELNANNTKIELENNKIKINDFIIQLYHSINPENHSIDFDSTQIILKVYKKDQKMWNRLCIPQLKKTFAEWPNVKVENNDEPDFFKKLYQDADDETKRAINKSMAESGGTVLNMNWDQVKNVRIEPKPPKGVEF